MKLSRAEQAIILTTSLLSSVCIAMGNWEAAIFWLVWGMWAHQVWRLA